MSSNNQLAELKSAQNLQDLASIISVPHQSLTYALYGIHRLGLPNYSTFKIAKKNGGERLINSPVKELKDIQKKVSKLLQECLNTIFILEGHRNHNKEIESISHGFLKGKSIITNAEPHKNKHFVLNIDLNDFFGTIHYGRVYGFLKQNKHFGLHEDVARAISNIVCYQNKLPQGAPTSPVISNLIGSIMDIRLISLAKKHGVFYTRYADDLTFSSNKKNFPKEIAYLDGGKVHIGNSLSKIIVKCGFEINQSKSRLQFKDSRQDVTGLTVNKKVNVSANYRGHARILWHKIKNGKNIYAIGANPKDERNLNYLVGVLSYIHNVRLAHRIKVGEGYVFPSKPTKKIIDSILDADAKMYRDVLFFKNFISNDKPVILCEGKTDIIYLKCALSSLASKHRSLISKGERKISFLRPTKTISQLFQISGGTGDIGNLISNYSSYYDVFRRFSASNPVIILIDNDSGASALRSLILKIKKARFEKADSFTHIVDNLYILQTPLMNGNDSAIEDLFDKKTLSENLNGKLFNYKTGFDSSKNYGKNHFAERVVIPKKKEIDFSEFNFLFDNIKKIIKEFKVKSN